MTAVEINLVVPDALAALQLYESVFPVERREVTAFAKGYNGAAFSLCGTGFHLLDENPALQLTAPVPGGAHPLWVNVVVEDLGAVFDRAKAAGFGVEQDVVDQPELGVRNALLSDPFGHLWMLHEVTREVPFEDRCRVLGQRIQQNLD